MKDKLSRIRSPWRRLLITLLVNTLLFASRFTPFRPRARVHWVGGSLRPRRLERALSMTVLFAAMFFFRLDQYMLWVIAWGGAFSLFIILQSVRKIAPQKRFHWVKNR